MATYNQQLHDLLVRTTEYKMHPHPDPTLARDLSNIAIVPKEILATISRGDRLSKMQEVAVMTIMNDLGAFKK